MATACTRPIFYVNLAAVVSEIPGLGSAARITIPNQVWRNGARTNKTCKLELLDGITRRQSIRPDRKISTGPCQPRQPVQCRSRWRDPQLLGGRGRRRKTRSADGWAEENRRCGTGTERTVLQRAVREGGRLG